MGDAITRREFLGGAGRVAAGAGAASFLGGAARAFAADEGAPGKGPAKLVVAVRDAHLKETGEKDCWSAMKAIGRRESRPR